VRFTSDAGDRGAKRHRPAYRAIAATAALALLVAGCSSSAGKSSGAGSAASGSPASSAPLSSGSAASTSNPVPIGILYTDDNPIGTAPEIQQAAVAASNYVNQNGGIGGRAVKIVACNGKNNAQNDAQCATQFVNAGVVTVFGLDGFWGGVGVSIIGKAGIANQTLPISGPEFSAPNAYPWEGSGVTASAAAASYIVQNKLKGSCAYVDIPSFAQQCSDDFQKVVESQGATSTSVAIPPAANDMSQYVTKLSSAGATGVLIVAGAPVPQNLVTSGAQQNFKPQWILPSQQPSFYKAVGSAGNGLISYNDLVDSADQSNADAAIFRTAMAKWEPNAALDAYSIMTFSNIVTLARLGTQVGGDKITVAGLPALLSSIKNLPQFMGPVLDASKHLPGLPNALHTGAYLYKWDGKALSQAGTGYYVVPGSTS